MLPQMMFFEYQISSSLFLLGALSGMAALGMSYFAEMQERAGEPVRKRGGIPAGRRVANVLLTVAYIAMAGALIGLWL